MRWICKHTYKRTMRRIRLYCIYNSNAEPPNAFQNVQVYSSGFREPCSIQLNHLIAISIPDQTTPPAWMFRCVLVALPSRHCGQILRNHSRNAPLRICVCEDISNKLMCERAMCCCTLVLSRNQVWWVNRFISHLINIPQNIFTTPQTYTHTHTHSCARSGITK